MAEVCIREFHFKDDYAAAIDLWNSSGNGIHVGPSDSPAELKKKLRRDPDLFLVAEAEGMLVGTVLGGFDGRRGLIYHLAVHGNYRSHGVGSRLMEEVEARLRSKGCIRCYLFVTPDNPEAMRYYEKRGWQVLNNVPYAKDLV
jgi:ribosomal protein S18 acetylase RimI-like enzyme